MDRVIIITGLRIQALRMVNSRDFTYSKGYLGLLSTLGASLGIIFCCAPVVPFVYHRLRPTQTEIYKTPDVPPSIPVPELYDGWYEGWITHRWISSDVLTDGLDYWARWKYSTVARMNAVALRIYDPSLGASRSVSNAA